METLGFFAMMDDEEKKYRLWLIKKAYWARRVKKQLALVQRSSRQYRQPTSRRVVKRAVFLRLAAGIESSENIYWMRTYNERTKHDTGTIAPKEEPLAARDSSGAYNPGYLRRGKRSLGAIEPGDHRHSRGYPCL